MKKEILRVGTLLNDNGKLGIISKVIEVGELRPEVAYISWRANYQVTYIDGTNLIIGCRALEQMIYNGAVEIYSSTTPLPPFLSPVCSTTTPPSASTSPEIGEEDDAIKEN